MSTSSVVRATDLYPSNLGSTAAGTHMSHWLRQEVLGYWHLRADERHGKPHQGNQELLVVRDKLEDPQVSLG